MALIGCLRLIIGEKNESAGPSKIKKSKFEQFKAIFE
jgi:hypothetical protein